MTTWHVEKPYGEPGTYISDSNTALVAKVYNEADAPVLAAAQDLLAALEDAEFLLRKVSINWREAGSMADSMARSAADARAAIAKAKG